jgi:uncharacterized protein (DUF1330 family)
MRLTLNLARGAAGALVLLWGAGQARADDVLIDQNARNVPAFVLMQAEMTDPDTFFHNYAVPAEVTISANDGRAQVATFGKQVLEGRWDNNWTIMLRFPSLAAASTWYHSPAYQAVIPVRQAATAYGNMVLFEGMPESALAWRVARYDGVQATLRFPLTLDPTPEYVVSVVPRWQGGAGSFTVSASFAETAVRHAVLSVEFKAGPNYSADAGLVTAIALRDGAGRRRTIARLHPRQLAPGQWQRVDFETEPRTRAGDADEIDLDKVTDVEFSFATARRARVPAGDIQIRNLKLVR